MQLFQLEALWPKLTMKKCNRCQVVLSVDARFCSNCGAPQPDLEATQRSSVPSIDLDLEIEPQLTEKFFLALKDRIEREHRPEQFTAYSERMYPSGFRDVIARRFAQSADRLRNMESLGMLETSQLNWFVEDLFEELLDFYIIRYCKDLNEVDLSEAILKYQNVPISEINLFQVVKDFLQFDHEPEKIYTDLLQMPLAKLKNASQAFLFPPRDEKILLVSDQSLLSNGKEGFAITARGLYWKAPFQKSQIALFTNLVDMRRKEDWIEINGHFFNAGLSLNVKMLRLLGRLKMWHR